VQEVKYSHFGRFFLCLKIYIVNNYFFLKNWAKVGEKLLFDIMYECVFGNFGVTYTVTLVQVDVAI
jgi:hypothetical protein